jgi:hypothetical protein
VVQVLAVFVMLIAAVIEIESILWAGPTLTVVGLLRAAVTRPLVSLVTLFDSLSAPFVCALIALLIAAFDWGPGDADVPVAVILTVYLLFFLPITFATVGSHFSWQPKSASHAPATWQFSLKSMLFAMTAICLIIALGRLLTEGFRNDDIIFGGYALVVLTLCGLVIWRFIAYRRRVTFSTKIDESSEAHSRQ